MFTHLIHRSMKMTLQLIAIALLALGLPSQVSYAAFAQPAGSCRAVSTDVVAAVCAIDQLQWDSGPANNFGGTTALGQTVVPTKHGAVCQVLVKMRRNVTAGATAVRMRVLRPDGSLIDTAWRTAAQIPPGDSIQIFDFGCDGPVVGGASYVGLVLDAATSPAAAYGWYGIIGDLYPPGAGYQKIGVGAWALFGGGWDFTFKLFMCA